MYLFNDWGVIVVYSLGIRANKPANRWVVVTSIIVVKAGLVKALAGKELIRRYIRTL